MSTTATNEAGRATLVPSKLHLSLVLGALAGLGPLTIDMYLPSFPSIATNFGVEVSAVELTVTTYLFGLALGQLFYGPISDRFGRRTPLLAGLAIYAFAAVGCALATSLPMLAAGRFLQALGGCAGMVVSRAVVRDWLDERASAQLYGSLILVMGVAPILAPILGGQVLMLGGWRMIFAALVVAAALVFTLILLTLPESLPRENRVSHRPSALVSTAIEVFKTPGFLPVALVGGLMQMCLFGYITGAPFVFMQLFEIAPEHFGYFFGSNALGFIIGSQVNTPLVARYGPARVLGVAVKASAAAALVLLWAGWTGASMWVFLPANFAVISSLGFIMPNATALAMSPFSKNAGIASAVLGSLQTVLGALAAMLVSLFAHGSARPMASTIAFGAISAFLLSRKALGGFREAEVSGGSRA